jgi:formylglycine-generating enzyme required for sulfatase activity
LTKIPEASARRDTNERLLARPASWALPFSGARDYQQGWAVYLGVPIEFENIVGMKFRLIPPGTYLMGSTQEQVDEALPLAVFWTKDRVAAEFPQVSVYVAEPFYLGQFELTRGIFARFVEEEEYKTEGERSGVGGWMFTHERKWHQAPEYTWLNERDKETAEHPVRFLAAEDVEEFCRWMRKYDGGDYVIPTEQQWEFACRAGTTTQRYSAEPILAKLAVCTGELRPVGTKPANPFGLYDMLGNVFEVTRSRDSSRRYATRGGCFLAQAADSECRSAYYANAHADSYQGAFAEGYRIALVGDLKKVVQATAKRQAPANP